MQNAEHSNGKRLFELSGIFIHPARPKDLSAETQVRAYVSIGISGVMRIYGIKILEGKHGLYVSWPRYRIDGKEYSPILITNAKIRTNVAKAILSEYNDGKFVVKNEGDK